MASVDGDVDMSPPATPTRAPLSPTPFPTIPSHRSRTIRFTDLDPVQPLSLNKEQLTSTEVPFETFEEIPPSQPDLILSRVTDEAIKEARKTANDRETVAKYYARALDQATACVHEKGLRNSIGILESALARVLQRFARGEGNIEEYHSQSGLSRSRHGPNYMNTTNKPTYAQVTGNHTAASSLAALPKKPIVSDKRRINQTRKPDNRIFIRLAEDHPSRSHHVHAVKSALTNKLGLEEGPVKAIQKVKSGIAIVPTSDKQGEELMSKAGTITSVLGGKVEKAEEWYTYVVDHAPRNLYSLDGSKWHITEKYAQDEAKSVTGLVPTKVSWSRKSIDNPAPTGTIVVSFSKPTRPFRLFGTSSLARQIIKHPKPSQCPKCWGYHDARLCNSERRCKQCSAFGHSSCEAPARCTNCKGPHMADEKYCPARPVLRKGSIITLSQSELKRIRHAGHRAWLLVNPINPDTEKPSPPTQC